MPPIKKISCALLILCGLLIVPAMAGTMYLDGSPQLSVNVTGINEFSPGTDVDLAIVVENTGINTYKLVQSGMVDRDDVPSTAKYLSVTLLPGSAPVLIKTEPQMVGDLKGSSSTKAVFATRINTGAPAGNYTLPVMLNYSYLHNAGQYSGDTVKYEYQSENITLNVPIRIKPDVTISVLSAKPEHLNAGTTGYLNMAIRNDGSEEGSRAIVKLTRNGNSPVVPVDSSVYIGNFPVNGTVSCRYKVSISDGAEAQTYPVDVVVQYENAEGDTVTSRSDTVGVDVGGKADFSIVSAPAEMHPGNKKTISVEYRNTGGTPVYSARARISAVDPFSSSDDIAYVGDLQPGESRVITYTIGVDRSATIKQYGLDSEIRYRDALDNTYVSDTLKVQVDVTRAEGLTAVVSNPIYLSLIAAAIIGAAYLVYTLRSRRKQ